MSNIKRLPNANTPKTEPVADVVRKLEEVLVRAKTGEIRAIAIAAVTDEGLAVTVYDSESDIWALLGALSYLQMRIGIAVDKV